MKNRKHAETCPVHHLSWLHLQKLLAKLLKIQGKTACEMVEWVRLGGT
jgi:hypothetical protein